MPGTRILHVADLHLGARHEYLGPGAEARRTEADALLSRIADFALRPGAGIGGLIIAGDLFDRHDPPAALVDAVIGDLRRLDAAGIRLLTVPGNHDEYSYPRCVYRSHGAAWPGTLVRAPAPAKVARWELGAVAVELYAMAYVAGRSRPPYDRFEVASDGGRRIAVLHGSLDAPWTDRSLPLQSPALAALGLDYLALGHIHRPAEVRLGSGWACYPGRIEGGGFDDPGCGELVLIDVAEKELVPRRFPFGCRRIAVESWNVSSFGAPEELDARFAEAGDPEAIVRVTLQGVPAFPIDAERLRERFAGCFRHLEVELSADAAAPPIDALAEERTVRGLFVRLARQRIEEAADPEARALAEAALRHGLAAFASPRTEAGEGGAGR